MKQDSKGYIWISSFDGLIRFDGHHFKIFKHDPLDSLTISSSIVSYVVEDNANNLWIKTNKGISRLNRSTWTFKNYTNQNSNIGSYEIPTVHDGNIYASDLDGSQLKKYNPKTDQFDKLTIKHDKDEFPLSSGGDSLKIGVLSEIQHDGTMYFVSVHGIWHFDPKSLKTTRVCRSSFYNPLNVFKDHTGRLWAGYWEGGLTVIDPKTKSERHIIEPIYDRSKIGTDKRVFAYITEYKDEQGKYWILASEGSTGSIVIIDPITEKYKYQHLTIEDEITPTFVPGVIICTQDGKIYVTTSRGLFIAEPQRQFIQNVYTYQLGTPADIFYDNLVRAGIQTDDGGYVFGLLDFNGIRIYNNDLHEKKAIKTYLHKGKKHDLDVRSFEKIGHNRYMLSGNTGLAIMENEKITPIFYIPRSQIDYKVNVLKCRNTLRIDDHRYWVRVVNSGLKIFNTASNTFTKDYKYADKAQKISLGDIRNIKFDNNGTLWINNFTDIFFYDDCRDEFIKFEPKKRLDQITSFHFDRENKLWLCGEKGLIHYDLIQKTSNAYTSDEGFAERNNYDMIFDRNGELWVKSFLQISKFDPKTKKYTDLTKPDGLTLGFNDPDGTYFIDKDNFMIVGNTGAISKINIDKFGRIKNPKPIIDISQVEGFSKNIEIVKDQNSQKQATLTHMDFPVNIIVNIINYDNDNTRKYQYRYANTSDTTWYECRNGVIPISTTEPGSYTIQAKGTINDLETSDIDTITFKIVPRWYQTLFAKISGFVSLLSLIIGLIRWRFNTKLNEIANKKELELKKQELAITLDNLKGAQLDALRSQMNPHFIFNSLNSIENFILKNERVIASEYLGKFSKLIRNILDNSKSESIPLTKEIETMKLYIELERIRTDNAFDVNYNISNNILDDNIMLPPMLMQPHVENAILHGLRYLEDKKGLLTVSMVITNDDCLEYSIQDNGIGRTKSNAQKTYKNYEHKSYGLDITQNRIDLYNQKNKVEITFRVEDLYDSNQTATGTKVVVLIPLI